MANVNPWIIVLGQAFAALVTFLGAWYLARRKYQADIALERSKHELQVQHLRHEHQYQDRARFMERRADLYDEYRRALAEWRQAVDAAGTSLDQLIASFTEIKGRVVVDYKDVSLVLSNCAQNQQRAAEAQATLLALLTQFEHHAPRAVHETASAWLTSVIERAESGERRGREKKYIEAVRRDLGAD